MSTELPDDAIEQIRAALFAGRKIEAIKLYREATGYGLKESKDVVEALEAELRIRSPELFTSVPGKGGCGLTVLALGVSVAAVSMACR